MVMGKRRADGPQYLHGFVGSKTHIAGCRAESGAVQGTVGRQAFSLAAGWSVGMRNADFSRNKAM